MKLGTTFIFIWALFRFVFHAFDFSNSELSSFFYFVGNDLGYLGFLLLILKTRLFLSRSKKFIKVLLIYSLWCLIVDVLLLFGIGAHDTAIYTQIDLAILGIGSIWSIIKWF